MKRTAGIAVPIAGNSIQTQPGKREKSRMAAAGRVPMIIREALLPVEAARPSNMPRPVARATRIRAGQGLILDRAPVDLIQTAAAPPTSTPRVAAKATRIKGDRGLGQNPDRAPVDLIQAAAALLNSIQKQAAKAPKIAKFL
ncbi:MAG: hypothetical protein ABI167_11365 [Nitrosospira sp.]